MQKKFGLIGHPIKHSMSPALFKAGYDGRYPYELIEGDDFEDSYRRFLEGYHGINVTAPFKELAFAKADILSDECRLIKATNLMVKTTEGVKAYNSDYLGVRMWLQEVLDESFAGVSPSGIRVLIAGCGGAGKAAAIAAASLGMKVILMNRNMDKAKAVAESISQMSDAPTPEVRPLDDFRTCFRTSDIIIYNIPAAIPALSGLTDNDFRGSSQASGTYSRKHILEANYKDPSFDKNLTDKAIKANPEIRFTKGSTWLVYQALTGYEIFTGEKPDLERISAVM